MSRIATGQLLRRFSRLGPRPLTGLLWFVALALCAWLAADLFWRFAAPASPASLSSEPDDPRKVARLVAARQPFGVQETATAGAAPAFQLIGVATGFGQDPGFAILQAGNDAPVSAMEGETVVPGVKLLKLHADHVELEVAGVRRELPLKTARPASGAVRIEDTAEADTAAPSPATGTASPEEGAAASPPPRAEATPPSRPSAATTAAQILPHLPQPESEPARSGAVEHQ